MLFLAVALVGAIPAPAPRSFLQKDAVVQHGEANVTARAYERELPAAGSFFDKSHETVGHIRTDLKEFYKTVGGLRGADLEEASRLQANYVSLLHQQEDEVNHQVAVNQQLQGEIEGITKDNKALQKKKQETTQDNGELEKQLKDLKAQVEQEVNGLEGLLGNGKASLLAKKQHKDDDADDDSDDDSDDDDESDETPKKAKAEAKKTEEDDSDDDSEDDDDSDDDAGNATSLVKTEAKDDDSDDDEDDDDSDDDEPSKPALVAMETEQPCHCTSDCQGSDDEPFCFVQSPQCMLAASCEKGSKGGACIKLDPKKGAWTLCKNIQGSVNATAKGPLLSENPNVAVAQRMLSALQKQIDDIRTEDEHGAEHLRTAFNEQTLIEKKKRKQVMKHQTQLTATKKELLEKKAKLTDEVHHLEEVNMGLHRQVDRFGQFLSKESAKLKDAVTPAAEVAAAPA